MFWTKSSLFLPLCASTQKHFSTFFTSSLMNPRAKTLSKKSLQLWLTQQFLSACFCLKKAIFGLNWQYFCLPAWTPKNVVLQAYTLSLYNPRTKIMPKKIACLLCISTSERMLAHAFTWSKTTKNIQKLGKKYLFHHAHERLTKLIFECFWSFLTMRTHAQACIYWSKYTTPVCLPELFYPFLLQIFASESVIFDFFKATLFFTV